MGRIPPAERDQILNALAAGASRAAAVRYAGFAEPDLLAELGEDAAFREAVLLAEARAEIASVGAIAKAAKAGDWRAGVYLLEHSPARPPLETSAHCDSHTKRCKVCDVPWARCPHTHETKGCWIASHLCMQVKGKNTPHPGSGHCWLHLGTTLNGERHAAKERAAKAVELLGIPLGNGDPFDLLTSAVQHSQSQLEGSAALVREALDSEESTLTQLDLQAALEFQTEAIRSAFRGGKAVVDAKVAERGAVLEDAAFALLKVFVNELLERVPKAARPQIQVWASQRLDELGAGSPVVH